jgi:small-conductance mechanosensitive channel
MTMPDLKMKMGRGARAVPVVIMLAGLSVSLGLASGRAQEPSAKPPGKVQEVEKPSAKAQDAEKPGVQAPEAEKAAGAPVVVNDKILFYIRSRILSISPENRAGLIRDRIVKLAKDPLFNPDSLQVSDGDAATDIVAKDLTIMSVTDNDAKAAGKTRQELAAEYLQDIRAAVASYKKAYNLKTVLLELLLVLGTTAALVLILVFTRKFFFKLYKKLQSWKDVRIRGIRFQKLEILSAAQMTTFLVRLARLLRALLLVVLFYFYLLIVLSAFPATRKLAQTILSYVLSPLSTAGRSFLAYLPKLFSIVVIVVITHYAVKLVKFFFLALDKGRISLPGFFPEWARPTYKIARFLIYVFAGVVIFPFLPGSDSSAFKGISIFLGALISLGSAGAISNVISGVVLTYMRAFKIGDRVKISETVGDITEKTLLVTRIRTIKNEEISIPNAMILGSHIINYSTSARDPGLILHTTVTIGYDAPWRKIHELLIAAARATEGVLDKPAPFVLQTSLDNFYVSYQINAYSEKPNEMAVIYARLHENIQDKFNEAGIEIMSPYFSALRDGNPPAMPKEAPSHKAPTRGFRIAGLEKLFGKSGREPGTDKD